MYKPQTKRTALRLLLGQLCAGLALAAQASPLFAQSVPVIDHPFAIAEEQKFAPVQATLERLVARKAKTDVNHLCVIGEDLDDGTRQAWVYWKEDRAIILWEPSAEGGSDLASSRRHLRMDRDVVPVHDKRLESGSTYLVSRDWANGLIAECGEQGTGFVIEKGDALKSLKPGKARP